MSSNNRKKTSEKKNITKKKSPPKNTLEELRDKITNNILKTTENFTEINGIEVAKDNQIIKYILKNSKIPTKQEPTKQEPTKQEPTKQEPTDQEPIDQEPIDQEPTDQEPIDQEPIDQEPKKSLLIRTLDNDPKYKNTYIGNNRYEQTYLFYDHELRFEHYSNIEKMLELTNNNDDSSIYKELINNFYTPKKISDKKLEKQIKEQNKKTYGRFRGDLILALISDISAPKVNKTRKLNIVPQLKNKTIKLNIINKDINKQPIPEPTIKPINEPIEEQIQNPPPAPEQEPFIEEEPLEESFEETTQEEPIINQDKLPTNIIENSEKEEEIQQKIGIPENLDTDSKEYNSFLFNKEKIEHESSDTAEFDFLYPELNDPNFNIKIAKRKEFNDTKFDGSIYDIKEQAEKMCNADFELLPHQLFVKNFLSYQTPYNCLLLYHMLGSGKTCSAIGVAEEMRSYMKQIGLVQKNKRILIVASPNVQNNFRLQLFDDRKLKKENGMWNLNTCIGNSLLNKINPSSMHELKRNQIISEINNLIKTYYQFVGYDKLANIIRSETKDADLDKEPTKEQKELEIKKIRQLFNNRLIIIDEVHNITLAQDNKEAKKVGSMLMRIARYAQNIRLLLLSATPVYNNYKEIIWLTNLMNAVDKRSSIKIEDVFDKEGNFVKERTTKDGVKLEGGRELLKRKLTGYVSYVRGENPYTFPFRIYPDTFSPENTFNNEANNQSTTPTPEETNKQSEEITGGDPPKPEETKTQPPEETAFQSEEATVPSEEATVPSEEATVPSEEATVPSEEATIPSEEATIPSEEATVPSEEATVPSEEASVIPLPIPVVITYPKIQMNLKPIEKPLQHLPVYLNPIGEYQEKAYKYIMENLRNKSFNTYNIHGEEREMPTFENMESFGYTHLQQPLESLNIIFPNPDFKETEKPSEKSEQKSDESQKSEEQTMLQTIGKSLGLSGGAIDSIESTSSDESSIESKIQENTEIIKNMTGKTGLSNIMTYDTIRESYELRKNFEYKPQILEKYGRIFHPDNIGKYSGKMGNISNIIRNSEGIIIIYSQYIDGGVVPLALMLEEMGFTRYGFASHTTSLLKTPPPSEKMLDAITMKTKEDFLKAKQAGEKHRGNPIGEFSQAKYVMITGDKTFSPNNLADIKYVTSKNNVHGQNVKVILISQAAAEGLDFKNIRQVHILSPWYNLNRIEQIIGRGVRNLSHCDLPFEKRNVEIYLHSTTPKNDEEPADLYLYRYAETKAIQIGEITRLMKEVAVDCLLNISQTNLTVDKLLENIGNQKIQIQLSSNPTEIDYKVGDKPFTDICDYKDNCNFVCSPNIEINDADITKNTYNTGYLKTNYSAIVKRIRELFREQNFYNREQLFNSINILRKYPDEQIDYVLSIFVDNNETIIDKYGRSGYLINNDSNYIFQPIEITDERSSLFDRTIPIDNKNINLEMEIDTTKQKKQPLEQIGEKTIDIDFSDKYENIINNLKQQLNVLETEKENALNKVKLIEDENDWYVHCGRIYAILTNENIHNVPTDSVNKYIIYHFLDTLRSEQRLDLIQYLYKTPDIETTKPLDNNETIIKQYFDNKIVERNGIRGIVLEVDKKTLLFIQDSETKEWNKSKPSENILFQSIVQKKYEIARENINNFVGFMHNFKKEGVVFKTKDMSDKRNNIGLRCSGSTKNDTIKRLNKVLESGPFFKDGDERNIYNDATSIEIKKIGFCVMLEIIMRYYNDIEMDKNPLVRKTWFFDLEKTIYNNLVNL